MRQLLGRFPGLRRGISPAACIRDGIGIMRLMGLRIAGAMSSHEFMSEARQLIEYSNIHLSIFP